jgi:hypothetical protein
MSLSIAYENVNDAQMRLVGTVVLYDGEPVYITDIRQKGEGDPKGDIFRVYAEPLPYKGRGQSEQMRKFISSKKFDMAPFPMGFMNRGGEATYLHRSAKKQQKQGLSNATLSVINLSAIQTLVKGGGAVRFEHLITYQEFLDCIKGKYPSIKEATELVSSGKAESVAFSRAFALCRDPSLEGLIYLFHKQDKVGFIMDGKLKLNKAARCLKESLQEVGIQC